MDRDDWDVPRQQRSTKARLSRQQQSWLFNEGFQLLDQTDGIMAVDDAMVDRW